MYKVEKERKAARIASIQRYKLSDKGKATKAAHNRLYKTTRKGKVARERARLKYQYNLTSEIYNQLMVEQNGCCAICSRHQTEFKQRLAVDHDHQTGKIRGLLCSGCNLTLGLMNDDPKRLKKAHDYLQEKS